MRFETERETYTENRKKHWDRIAHRSHSVPSRFYQKALHHVYGLQVPHGSRVLELGCGKGDLLAALEPGEGVGIDLSEEMIALARRRHPRLTFACADAHDLAIEERPFDYIILSDLLNDLWDIQLVLEGLRRYCHKGTRLIFNFHSRLWEMPLRLAQALGQANPLLPQNWIVREDLVNLLELAGFETLRAWEEIALPAPIPFLSALANRYLVRVAPFRWLALSNFLVARPRAEAEAEAPLVSVVVAARNEEGHIAELLERIPEMGRGTEIIFVEGGSSDGTYAVIEKAIAENPGRRWSLLRQKGTGKGDAVREGFAAAQGEVLMILDADITVPPEDLPRFLEVLMSGDAEFVNGVRLVYPMDRDAMRFFNLVGNKFFAQAFSWVLGQPIRDTLCGTKVIRAGDYARLAANRSYFGDFDPFGDFDLLFGAAKLNLKIMEVPVRYRARRYGQTNIQRWRHGLLLLRMVLFAARRIKFV